MRRLALLIVVAACGPTAATVPPAAPSNETAAEAVESSSVAVVVVIDRSGSMMGAKMDGAAAGAWALVQAMPDDAIFGAVAFDSEPMVLVRPQRASSDDRIRADLGALTSGGGTAFLSAVREAGAQLEPIATDRKLIVFMSDGEAPYDQVVESVGALAAQGVTFSTIAISADADVHLLGAMAEAGHGRMYVVADPYEIGPTLVKELELLRR
jgi:Mg-chelatase subunit ChlD